MLELVSIPGIRSGFPENNSFTTNYLFESLADKTNKNKMLIVFLLSRYDFCVLILYL